MQNGFLLCWVRAHAQGEVRRGGKHGGHGQGSAGDTDGPAISGVVAEEAERRRTGNGEVCRDSDELRRGPVSSEQSAGAGRERGELGEFG
jgi:hypothetical protein